MEQPAGSERLWAIKFHAIELVCMCLCAFLATGSRSVKMQTWSSKKDPASTSVIRLYKFLSSQLQLRLQTEQWSFIDV